MNPSHCTPATQGLEFLRSLNLAIGTGPEAAGPSLNLPEVLEDLVTRLRWRSYSVWTHEPRRRRLRCIESWSYSGNPPAWPAGVALARGDEVPGRAIETGVCVDEEPFSGGQTAVGVAVEIGGTRRAVIAFGLPGAPGDVSEELVEIIGETGAGAFAQLYLADRRHAQPDPLTPREHDVLRWAAEGFNVADIAKLLGIEPSTVKTHLERVYLKLGASDRAAAVAQGFRAGLLR